MVPYAFSVFPDHCAREKYAGARLRKSLYINELWLRTFGHKVHSSGEKGPKRRQKGP
jgi:hypothetical protein